MHARFWQDRFGEEDVPGVTAEKPLGLASYRADLLPTAYFQPLAAGDTLIDMPAFLTSEMSLDVPLEATYRDAWSGVPRRWKRVIESP